MASRMIALIPAYEPDEKLTRLTEELKYNSFEIVIVDDGSGSEYKEVFASSEDRALILRHTKNRGKGAALKTGMEYIYRCMSYSESIRTDEGTVNMNGKDSVVVTVDADGQHKVSDVLRVAEIAASRKDALVLGSRTFKGNVPARSLAGNTITRHVYSLASGVSIRDTQTGLRAFSINMIPKLMEIGGERYEYEINVLLRMTSAGTPIIEEDIETVYIEDNKSSHFNTLKDSFRVYREILKFSASSLVSFSIDYVLFAALVALGSAIGVTKYVIAANIIARLISASVNYTINRKMVFKSNAAVRKSALQYFTLVGVILAANTIVLETLVNTMGMASMPAKLFTEIVFFIISWTVQKYLIFYKNESDADEVCVTERSFRDNFATEEGR